MKQAFSWTGSVGEVSVFSDVYATDLYYVELLMT